MKQEEWDEDDWAEEEDEWEEDEEDEWPEFGEDADARDLFRGLALGFLAMLPLLVAYEMGVAMLEGGWRSTSELVLFQILRPLGEQADMARRVVLLGLTVLCAVYCLRRRWELGPLLGRTVAEGLVAALLLGPLLVFLTSLIGVSGSALPQLSATGQMDAGTVLLISGGAAHEELLFRVGFYGAAYVLLLHLLKALRFGERSGRWLADVGGLVLSAFAFAAIHLEVTVSWLGAGGEPFHGAVFTYRVLAGILLGLLFRLRGPGVAAWAHALFNLALMLGAGPDVFQ